MLPGGVRILIEEKVSITKSTRRAAPLHSPHPYTSILPLNLPTVFVSGSKLLEYSRREKEKVPES